MGKLKYTLLLLGSFVGFSLAFAASMAAGNGIEQMVLNGAIGCLVSGVLFKWVIDMFFDSFVTARRKALSAAAVPAPSPATMAKTVSNAASNILKNTKK
jgi:uncharacterized membrane protein YjfL (UPF0719 family)